MVIIIVPPIEAQHPIAAPEPATAPLWLWPLPPAEPFELAVEWPFGGIDLRFTELDGAAVVAVARRSVSLWPD